MSPLLLHYDGTYTRCRIDNTDGDGSWLTGDTNGNGVIDENEDGGTLVEFESLRSSVSNGPSTGQQASVNQNSRILGEGVSVASIPPVYSPGFRDYPFLQVDGGNLSYGIETQIDYDDLQQFNLGFNRDKYRRFATYQSVSIGKTVCFESLEEKASADIKSSDSRFSPHHRLEVSFGTRYSQLRDEFTATSSLGLLGGFIDESSVDDYSVGPEMACIWQTSFKGWSLSASGSLMWGYRTSDTRQQVRYGVDTVQADAGIISWGMVPGGTNPLIGASMTDLTYQRETQGFSPLAEVGFSTNYALGGGTTLKFGYAGYFVGDLRFAEDTVNWALPNMGINNVSGDDVFTETVYASVDLRR